MPRDPDPSGYYSALGVPISATDDDIKKAFKAKARQFHPDKNPAPEATRQFQLVSEAYGVLGNAAARATYDAQTYRREDEESPSATRTIEPITCCICHKISAQPRYVIYWHVTSVVFATWRGGRQGVFCSECGAKEAYKASLRTWLVGWWGIPWGLIYSIHAIFSSMLGGEQPPLNNFRILSWQALYFLSIERQDLAQAIALDAVKFATKVPLHVREQDPEIDGAIGAMTMLVTKGSEGGRSLALRDLWGFSSKTFKVQLVGMVALVGTIAILVNILSTEVPRSAYRHLPPTESATSVVREVPEFKEPILPLPVTGKRRTLWKQSEDIILAPLRVITADGSPSYYVKVVAWQTHAPALVFFVRSGETASVEVPIGSYELRYAAGENWFGEEYLFGPNTTYLRADERLDFEIAGDKVVGYTIELVKQRDGNLKESSIQASEF